MTIINDVIKSAQKRDTLENFFSKIGIMEPLARSTVLLLHTTQLFNSFLPVEREIAPKEKSFAPIFSETIVFFRNIFSPSKCQTEPSTQ